MQIVKQWRKEDMTKGLKKVEYKTFFVLCVCVCIRQYVKKIKFIAQNWVVFDIIY